MKSSMVFRFLVAISIVSLLPIFNAISPVSASAGSEVRRFRLLAVERQFDSGNMRSGEFLIAELLNYQNWNNATTDYVSYIHLLSMYTADDVLEPSKPYWRGSASKENVRNEIVDFLGRASPGEIVIFYYVGHSAQNVLSNTVVLTLDQPINSTELVGWLSSGGLPQASVVVVLDTCYSGWWISEGSGGVLGPGRTVMTACSGSQTAWGWLYSWSWFTYIGLIEGFWYSEDSNDDGWISAAEDFVYAKPKTEEYSLQMYEHELQSPVSFFGVADGDIPLVQRDPAKPFPNWDVGVVSVRSDSSSATIGSPIAVLVMVENQGAKLYTGDVDTYHDSEWIGTLAVYLLPGENTTLTFIWETSDALPGSYVVNAVADVAPGEVDLGDNSCFGDSVTLLSLRADLTGRGGWSKHSKFSISKHGVQTLFGLVENLGGGDCYVRVQFLLVEETGVVGVVVARNLVNDVEVKVSSNQKVTLAVNLWEVGGQPLDVGKYFVRATCMFSATGAVWKQGDKAKAFSFSIVP